MPHCRLCASFRRWQCWRVAIGALFVSLVVAHSAIQEASAQAVPDYQIDTDFSLEAQSTAPILAENYLSGSIVRVTHTIDLPNALLPGARYFWSFKIDERARFLLSEGGFIGTTEPLALTNVLPESLDLSDWLIVEAGIGDVRDWGLPPTQSTVSTTCTKIGPVLPALTAFGDEVPTCFKVSRGDTVTIFRSFPEATFTDDQWSKITSNALAFSFYLRNQDGPTTAAGIALYPWIGYATTNSADQDEFILRWNSGPFLGVVPNAWNQYLAAFSTGGTAGTPGVETVPSDSRVTALAVGMTVSNSRTAEYLLWGAQVLDMGLTTTLLPEQYPFFPNQQATTVQPAAPTHVQLDQALKPLMTIGYSEGADPPASTEDCTYRPSDPDGDGTDPAVTYVCLVGFGGFSQGASYVPPASYNLPPVSVSYRIRIE